MLLRLFAAIVVLINVQNVLGVQPSISQNISLTYLTATSTPGLFQGRLVSPTEILSSVFLNTKLSAFLIDESSRPRHLSSIPPGPTTSADLPDDDDNAHVDRDSPTRTIAYSCSALFYNNGSLLATVRGPSTQLSMALPPFALQAPDPTDSFQCVVSSSFGVAFLIVRDRPTEGQFTVASYFAVGLGDRVMRGRGTVPWDFGARGTVVREVIHVATHRASCCGMSSIEYGFSESAIWPLFLEFPGLLKVFSLRPPGLLLSDGYVAAWVPGMPPRNDDDHGQFLNSRGVSGIPGSKRFSQAFFRALVSEARHPVSPSSSSSSSSSSAPGAPRSPNGCPSPPPLYPAMVRQVQMLLANHTGGCRETGNSATSSSWVAQVGREQDFGSEFTLTVAIDGCPLHYPSSDMFTETVLGVKVAIHPVTTARARCPLLLDLLQLELENAPAHLPVDPRDVPESDLEGLAAVEASAERHPIGLIVAATAVIAAAVAAIFYVLFKISDIASKAEQQRMEMALEEPDEELLTEGDGSEEDRVNDV